MRRVLDKAPWLAGFVGACLFVRPLLSDPAHTLLDRVFWYDALINVSTLAAQHRHFSSGPGELGLLDWLYSGHLFHPYSRPLVTSELIPLGALVTWPLAAHPVLAHNLLLFAAMVLNVVAGAAFARTAGARPIAATVAGIGLSFCAYTGFSSGRVQLMFVFPLAFALAGTLRWAQEGGRRNAVAVALWTLTQALLCLYYALFLALVLPVVALASRLARKRPGVVKDFAWLGGALLAVAVPVALLLWPYRELRSKLGLQRGIKEVIAQGGDLQYFLWADASTLFGGVLRDLYKWDTAVFPGFVILLGALGAGALWVKREPRRRWIPLALVTIGALATALGAVWMLCALLVAALGWLVFEARRGRVSTVVVSLVALAVCGFILFLGPAPRAWDQPIGWSPYDWLYRYVPFVDGLRVARRGALLVQLALCVAAALALSRLEALRHGRVVVLGLAAFALMEGVPLSLGARRVDATCVDRAFQHVRSEGGTVAGELRPKPDHLELARLRFQAELCGVSSNQGPGGFAPPLAGMATDALLSLPDPAVHAWLWSEGFRHVILRGAGSASWLRSEERRLAPIVRSRNAFGRDVVLSLATPTLESVEVSLPLAGEPLPIRQVTCDRGLHCPAAHDGSHETRWMSGANMRGGETLMLSIDRATVTGVEWSARSRPCELPRGVAIEGRFPDGAWFDWARFDSISLTHAGESAVTGSLRLSLPPREVTAVRLRQLGSSARCWLSATELEVSGTAALVGTFRATGS